MNRPHHVRAAFTALFERAYAAESVTMIGDLTEVSRYLRKLERRLAEIEVEDERSLICRILDWWERRR